MNILITLVNEFSQLGIALYYFKNFLDKKAVKKATAIVIILFYMIAKLISYRYPEMIITIICFFASALVAGFLYRSSITQIIWISITFVLIGLTSEMIASTLLTFFINERMADVMDNSVYRAVIMIISKVILFIIIKIIIVKFSKHFAFRTFRYSFSLIIFPILSILNVYSIMYMQFQIPYNTMFATAALTVGLILLLMSIVNMQTIIYNIQKIKSEYEFQIEKEKHLADIEIIQNHEGSIRDLRKMIHDFKNHLISLNGLNKSKGLEYEAYYNEIINALDEKIKNTYEEINNSIISNIFYSTYRKCKENNINLHTAIQVNDLSFLSPMTSSVIFSNLIDNAIRACLELQEDKNRYLKIEIYYSNSFIVIEIINSFSGAVKMAQERILTTKKNEQNHGYGLDIVKNAVQQNDGSILIDYTEKEFTVIISFEYSSEKLQ